MSNQLQVSGAAKIRDIQGPVVANSGVISALDGDASQYVRGDGTLADFPTSTGGGSSVSYYLNSSVSQGTIGGVAYRELSKEPIIGAGTDIAIAANGYVANYLTDANDPDVLSIPGGNFNCEFYFSVNNNTGNPYTYAELYKYDGSTFTLLGSSVGVPEYINQGTIIAPYYFAIPVPTSALAVTDRLAIRIYVNVDGRTVTLHTENSHLCQVVTTLSKGMVSLNNLTDQSQYLATGTSGTDFNIVSSVDTHTFNLPVASASNTGKLSSTDWSTFNGKVPYTGANADVNLGTFDLSAYAVSADILEARLNGTASSPLILRTGTSGFASGLDAISLISSPSSANTLSIISDVSSVTKRANIGLGLLTATRTYTLPDASGTLALTSNLSSYVPYTGATANVDLGINSLFAYDLYANGNGTNNANLYLKQGISSLLIVNGYSNILATGSKIGFQVATSAIAAYYADLQFSSLTAQRTYTLPDANGTLALTSDLSGYVTLATAQTISGAKTFSASVVNDDGLKIKFGSASNLTASYLTLSAYGTTGPNTTVLRLGTTASTISELIFSQSSSYAYTYPAATGTLALTSDLSSYVTLATAQTITANKTFSEFGFFDKGVLLKQNIYPSASGYNGIGAISGGFYFSIGQTTVQTLLFNSTTPYQYTFPSATGTITLGTGTTNYVSKWTGTNTIGNSLIFDNGTNVGIGNTNTSYTLDVSGTGRFTGALTYPKFIMSGGSDQSELTNAVNNDFKLTNSGNFRIINNSNTAALMTVTNAGNVGINCTPNAQFEVLGSTGAALTDGIRVSRNTLQNSQYGVINYTSGILNLTGVDTSGGGAIRLNTSDGTTTSERMRITSGGNVGIGNTGASDQRLSLSGVDNTSSNYALVVKNSSLSTLLYVRNDGQCYISGLTWVYGSDRRLKENINYIETGLDKILALKPAKFDYIQGAKNNIGWIAQDVEEVIPEAITINTIDDKGHLGLKSDFIVPYLVKAMQEQNQIIQELNERLNKAGL